MASQNTTAIPSEPATPQPSHASLPSTTTIAAVSKPQSKPPTRSTKLSKTPTPPISPPPTIEAAPPPKPLPTTMTPADLATASPETLRAKVTDLQRQLQETKTTTSAHHTLQLHMLAQESSAALERLAVEARMERHESEVIHLSSQRSAKAVQPPSLPEGCIPVNRDLYLCMGNEIRELRDANQAWRDANAGLERVVGRQESEIASLSDKVTLMRERIRENREHLNRVRSGHTIPTSTPSRSSLYGTPQRSQGLEALLQASEMTGLQPQSQHKRKGGHTRNTHSLSSLPATPQRKPLGPPPMAFMTPSNRRTVAKVPATAPMPRTSAMRTPTNVYSQPVLPVPQRERAGSDGTVSASDSDDEVVGDGMGGEGEGEDSEAETDILGHGDVEGDVGESGASRAASQMLRASQQDGSGMKSSFASSGEALRQTKLFGAITKGGVPRAGVGIEGASATKRKRSEEDVGSGVARVGLGISGVRD
ncbi:hypothetical protein LTR56_002861 [Elasticomyces elasticus]|nr:hypothetical protein LTR56_002861 [Elasticomyces elasticus]KAK3666681.1 hypothetical protein LTR22_002268 [Elasticomyces elasticus]KAK4920476.1 hypothetical protein LTR49_012068 [Elasticomyces elasticus]KAK5759237.1 hypothetical protein LTS12_010560 [Elasticomyces elasticus]